MTREAWLNFPVKDTARSKEFFRKIGFKINEERSNSTMTGMSVGTKEVHVMLFEEKRFSEVVQNPVSDARSVTEIIVSFDVDSREEVEKVAKLVEEAGGNVFSKPEEIQGWMYGCAFTDPDGHRWNALYMDMSKMPK